MKLRSIFCIFFMTTAALRAEFDLDAFLKQVKGSPENAPAITAAAAEENPKSLQLIVSSSVSAMPEQAVEIVRALLKVMPKQAAEIVRAAVLALPKLSAEIESAAVAECPEATAEIRKVSEDARKTVETAQAAPNEGNRRRGTGQQGQPEARPAFPVQPVRPDVVSPSS